MKKINEKIVLRPVKKDEEDFWKEVFCDSVRGHFSTAGLSADQLNELLEMQYQAQKADYERNYPQAENDVILYDGNLAGRVILSTEHNDLHLIDIAVLSDFRNRGIGTAILENLFEKSRRTKLPIRFYVEKNNPAFRLYERLGFETIADVQTHFQMQWREQSEQIQPKNLTIKS